MGGQGNDGSLTLSALSQLVIQNLHGTHLNYQEKFPLTRPLKLFFLRACQGAA